MSSAPLYIILLVKEKTIFLKFYLHSPLNEKKSKFQHFLHDTILKLRNGFAALESSGIVLYIWAKFRINRVTGLEIVGVIKILHTHTHTHTRTRTHTRTMPILKVLFFCEKADTRLKIVVLIC